MAKSNKSFRDRIKSVRTVKSVRGIMLEATKAEFISDKTLRRVLNEGGDKILEIEQKKAA